LSEPKQFHHVAAESSINPMKGLLMLLAAFWAAFGAIVVGGILERS
jgi:hypothetical protein